MYRTWWIRASLTLVLALMLVQGGLAQQRQHQRHHPGGTSTSQEQPTGTRGETDDEDVEEVPMMQQMRGMRRQMRRMMGGRMMGGGMTGSGWQPGAGTWGYGMTLTFTTA